MAPSKTALKHIFPLFLIFLLAGGQLPSAQAQTVEIEANIEDAFAVQGTILDLFDAMRDGDAAAARAVFHEDARLFTAAEEGDEPELRPTDVDAFAEAVGAERDEVWDERIWDLEVQVDGRMASAWMQYAFYRGDELSHCGANSVQLFQSADDWQITQLTDTRREDCEVPRDIRREREQEQ